jgi:hypothetical protein
MAENNEDNMTTHDPRAKDSFLNHRATDEGSISETYRSRKTYSHESSKKSRAEDRGGVKRSDPINDMRASHRCENSDRGAQRREATLALNRQLAARQAHTPHISFESDDARQRSALAKKNLDQQNADAARQQAELDAAMKRHMPS